MDFGGGVIREVKWMGARGAWDPDWGLVICELAKICWHMEIAGDGWWATFTGL
jgi:hypothetical protein